MLRAVGRRRVVFIAYPSGRYPNLSHLDRVFYRAPLALRKRYESGWHPAPFRFSCRMSAKTLARRVRLRLRWRLSASLWPDLYQRFNTATGPLARYAACSRDPRLTNRGFFHCSRCCSFCSGSCACSTLLFGKHHEGPPWRFECACAERTIVCIEIMS